MEHLKRFISRSSLHHGVLGPLVHGNVHEYSPHIGSFAKLTALDSLALTSMRHGTLKLYIALGLRGTSVD